MDSPRSFERGEFFLRRLFLQSFFLTIENDLSFFQIHIDGIAVGESAFEHLQRQWVENQPLNRALETFGGPHSAISSPPLGKAEQTSDSRILCQVKIFYLDITRQWSILVAGN